MRGGIWIRLAVLVALVVGTVIAHVVFHAFDGLTSDRVAGCLESTGPFAPIVFAGVMAAAVVISPIPSIPLAVTGGMLFGPFLGGVYSLAGALGGAITSFLIARHLGREVIERLIRKPIAVYPGRANRLFIRLIFLSRLIPVVSFDVVSYGAGLTTVSLGSFAIATALGMIPFTFVYTYFGALMFVSPWVSIVLGLLFLALFLTLPVLVRRFNLFGLKELFSRSEAPEEQSNE